MTQFARYFAIVPAAGDSSRMGCAKLTLPWQGKPLIEHTLRAWSASRVAATVIVVQPEHRELAAIAANLGAVVVTPILPPPDMRASVAFAVGEIRRLFQPTSFDGWLVAPADMPQLSTPVIDRLIATHAEHPDEALTPALAGRRGHPVLFPWHWSPRLRYLDSDRGINTLLDEGLARSVECSDLAVDPAAFDDIDTPDDLRRLRG